jgi:hypothetical protein
MALPRSARHLTGRSNGQQESEGDLLRTARSTSADKGAKQKKRFAHAWVRQEHAFGVAQEDSTWDASKN